VSHARTVWEEGREPGRQVVALGAAVALTAAALDLVTTEGIGLLFDLVFVPLCAWLALRVRLDDFFTVGVLPPLLMVGTFVLLGMGRPETLADPGDGAVQAVISGLSHHSEALLVGYLLCLAILLIRHRVLTRVPTRNEPDRRLRV
jgi:membrane-bound metal-dependent hydrolase YbcI (DUF457 family)